MPAAALPFVLPAAGSLIGALGNRKPRTSTSQTQTSSQQTTQALLSGPQRRLMRQLAALLSEQLAAGPNVPQSERNLARGQINQSFDVLRPALTSRLTAQGFGESGKLNAGLRDLEIARASQFQTAEAGLRQQSQQRFLQLLGLGQEFIRPTSFQQTGTSSAFGTGTQPGTPFLSSLGGTVGDLGVLLGLFGPQSMRFGNKPGGGGGK